MKRKFSFANVLPLLLGVVSALSLSASAQHLISSKAGFVNRADGVVMIQRADSEDGQPGRASLGTQMRDGDRLMTEADGRAEILLTPGSYIRLNEKSQIKAIKTQFDGITFELVAGTLIVEIGSDPNLPVGEGYMGSAARMINKKTPAEIITPNGAFTVSKDSLVRVDATMGATWVAVRQGEIQLGNRDIVLAGKSDKVKRGKLVRLSSTTKPELAKIDSDKSDQFDAWSFGRAQTLVSANLAALRQNSVLAGGWFYNSFYGCYTFIPGRGYLVSPYGFGFFRNFADCYWYNPYGYGYGGYYGNGWGYGNNGNNGGVVSTLPPRVIAGVDRNPIRREIPAERGIETDTGSRGFDRADTGGGFRSVSTSSATVSAPAATSTISAPAPARSESSGGGGLPTRGGGNN